MNIPMKWYASSQDPNKISLTLKGLVPLLVFLGGFYGIEIPEEDLRTVFDASVDVIVKAGTLVSAGVTFYGLVRKLVTRFR